MLGHCLLSVFCYTAVLAGAAKGPTTDFKTEAQFRLSAVNISILTGNRSLLAPGYLFITNSKGLQIYDQDGSLVWLKPAPPVSKEQDFRPCDYLGEDGTHLCWHETTLEGHLNTAPSRNVVYDNRYAQVAPNYTTGIDDITPNMHSFHMLPGGQSFLQPVYVPREWDLTPYAGNQSGSIWDGCFQEIDTETATPLFQWCVSDHFPLWESTVYFTETGDKGPVGQTNVTSPRAGRGTTQNPWDFFHINAIDKNFEGDYLVSGRHFDQILKIAGLAAMQVHGVEPGTALWRLGGFGNQFHLGFTFTKQHAVRYISTSSSETVISLLNNAWEGSGHPSAERSAGQIIRINNETMHATLLREYPHPYGRLSPSRGDLQLLPNNNIFMGWGELPDITEFDQDGTVLFHAHLEDAEYGTPSYRAFKAPWVGKPSWNPKLLAYRSSCEPTSPLVLYVSWNGATEIRSWRFYLATEPHGPWILAGQWAKDGFETRVTLSNVKWLSASIPHVSVQALDAKDRILGSTTSKTWVPNPNMNVTCDDSACFEPRNFTYDEHLSYARICKFRGRPTFLPFIVLILLVESLNYALQALSVWVLEKFRLRGFNSIPEEAMASLPTPD